MATAAARSAGTGVAASGRSNPNPNADGPKLRSPLGKPVPLSDITNTGRPNAARSIHVADLLKENAKLLHLLGEKSNIIELSRVEMHKLSLALQASRQQNRHLAQTHCQLLAELNIGKDKLNALQHELSCTTAVLKVKNSELEEVREAIPSKLAAVEGHQIYNRTSSTSAHHLVETQSSVPSKTGCQEPLKDKTNKRNTNKPNSELSEGIKKTDIVQDHDEAHLQPIGSMHLEDLRKHLRRRSARLNQGSTGIPQVPSGTLYEDTFVPLASSSFSVPELYAPCTSNDMGRSLQNEIPCNATVQEIKTLELKHSEINEKPQSSVNVEEIQEACSRIAGVEAHQIDNKDSSANQNDLPENQPYLPVNIEHPEPAQKRGNKKRARNKKLELCEDRKESNEKEETNVKCRSNSSEPWHHADNMESRRRKSLRLNPGSFEVKKGTCGTLHEDVMSPLTHSRLNPFIDQRGNAKQKDLCPNLKSSEEQATDTRSSLGRPSRRATKKIVSYKEVPLNVKMRQP